MLKKSILPYFKAIKCGADKIKRGFFFQLCGEMWQDTGDGLWKHRDEATVMSTFPFIQVEVSPTLHPLS